MALNPPAPDQGRWGKSSYSSGASDIANFGATLPDAQLVGSAGLTLAFAAATHDSPAQAHEIALAGAAKAGVVAGPWSHEVAQEAHARVGVGSGLSVARGPAHEASPAPNGSGDDAPHVGQREPSGDTPEEGRHAPSEHHHAHGSGTPPSLHAPASHAPADAGPSGEAAAQALAHSVAPAAAAADTTSAALAEVRAELAAVTERLAALEPGTAHGAIGDAQASADALLDGAGETAAALSDAAHASAAEAIDALTQTAGETLQTATATTQEAVQAVSDTAAAGLDALSATAHGALNATAEAAHDTLDATGAALHDLGGTDPGAGLAVLHQLLTAEPAYELAHPATGEIVFSSIGEAASGAGDMPGEAGPALGDMAGDLGHFVPGLVDHDDDHLLGGALGGLFDHGHG